MQKRQFFLVISVTLLLLSLTVSMTARSVLSDDDDYVLVFSDEFNMPRGSQPDAAKWVRPQRNPSTWARWISASKDVVYIKSGKLVCRAIPNRKETTDTASMLTGAVETRGKFSFRYGKVELRMKTNLKKGNFPAAWLKAEDRYSDVRYGEIDVMETFGSKSTVQHTVHTHMTYTLKKKSKTPTFFRKDVDVRRWHVYGMEWTPDSIVWTIDGEVTGIYHKSDDPQELSDGQWTFDYPFFLRLNQSLGDGSYDAFTPIMNQVYETQFDWIRVYQRISDQKY